MTTEFSLPGVHARFTHHEHDYQVAKAFGPNILETRLPGPVLAGLITLTDELLADEQRRSYGSHLVGQIKEEPEIPLSLLKAHGVYDYIRDMFAEYVLASIASDADAAYRQAVTEFQASSDYKNPVHIDVEAAWLVSQRAGEYNPIHNHSQSTLSSVMYLKIPEDLQAIPFEGKVSVDGCIEWVNASTQPMHNATVRITPRAGFFYIFPATLLHLVYPFKANSERRSLAINASHRY